jgi:subtilisin family serine protease
LPEGFLRQRAEVVAQRRRVLAAQGQAIYALAGSDAGPARPYPVIPFLRLEVGPDALAALEASPWVRAVHAAQVHAPHLAETVPLVQADQAAAAGFDGTGQVVVVLDTGTDAGHQNFPPGKIVAEACFADGATSGPFGPQPQNGGGDCPGGGDEAFGPGAGAPCAYHSQCFHGTHVAGIAAGAGPQYPGVAPGASLIPIQVFSEFPASTSQCAGVPCPLAWSTDQDLALLHVFETLRHSHEIAAVNLSLGSGAFDAPCDGGAQASTKAAVDQLRSVGIAVVGSSGNNGCDGVGCTDAISAPACISTVVSVGATRDNDATASYGNRAPFMSLFAPGHSVVAPRYFTSASYMSSSGTSMSAPHVTGAWAILRQAVPGGSVATLLSALQDSGKPIWSGVRRIEIRDALGLLGFPECDDGVDNDGDGGTDGDDVGCDDAADLSERSSLLPCDDGLDNDGDGATDTADAGCLGPGWVTEDPECSDGADNDGDGGTDSDGAPPDPQCATPYLVSEAGAPQSCALGPELALLLPLLAALRRRPR